MKIEKEYFAEYFRKVIEKREEENAEQACKELSDAYGEEGFKQGQIWFRTRMSNRLWIFFLDRNFSEFAWKITKKSNQTK